MKGSGSLPPRRQDSTMKRSHWRDALHAIRRRLPAPREISSSSNQPSRLTLDSMIERAFVYVAGPPGCGKTTFVKSLLRAAGGLACAARCVRNDTLPHAREAAPKRHPELRQRKVRNDVLREFGGHPRKRWRELGACSAAELNDGRLHSEG